MKVKTKDLTGAALDWAVADALGYEPMVVYQGMPRAIVCCVERSNNEAIYHDDYSPSISWVYGGPLIDKFDMDIGKIRNGGAMDGALYANIWAKNPGYPEYGPTPLIAICRAVVLCELGEEIEIPDELMGAE